MPELNLSKMDLKELRALNKQVEKEIENYEERKRAEALAELEAKARELGFTIGELTGGQLKGNRRRSKSPPKFRNPDDPSLTWTGKGRKPDWFKAAMEAGITPDQMEIS